MGLLNLELSGDWNRAVLHMKNLAANLNPDFKAQMYEDGEFVLEKLKGHIQSQDLGWTPLSPHTVALKHGNSTIYVETGTLLGGLSVRRVKSSADGCTIIVGASPWKGHSPSGRSLSEIMGWMEYGTSRQPARPLIRPTYEEVQGILKNHWKELFSKEVNR